MTQYFVSAAKKSFLHNLGHNQTFGNAAANVCFGTQIRHIKAKQKPMGGCSRKTRPPYSAASTVSALETSKLPGCSRLSRVTTPSSTIMA